MAALVLVGSLFAVIYIGRIIEAAYFQELPESRRSEDIKEVSWLMLVPMWVLVIANIYFGIDTSLTTEAANSASEWLFQTNNMLENKVMEGEVFEGHAIEEKAQEVSS